MCQQTATRSAPGHVSCVQSPAVISPDGEMKGSFSTLSQDLSWTDGTAFPHVSPSLATAFIQSSSFGLGPTVTRNSLARRRPRKAAAALACDFPQCDLTFSRKWELNRHKQVKHATESITPFICGARGCYKGDLPWSFVRPDKLTSHIKATHNLDTHFKTCPVEACAFGPSTLEDLGVHISRAHQPEAHGRAVLNATTCKVLRCPLWRCRKAVTSDKLIGHIESHPATDIEVETGRLQAENLLVDFTPSLERQMRGPSGFTVQLACPVCTAILDNIEQFVAHLSANHIYEPRSGEHEHFLRWKATWALSADKEMRSHIEKLSPWDRVNLRPWYLVRRSSEDEVSCPMCSFRVSRLPNGHIDRDGHFLIAKHHLSFLRPEADVIAELYPHRMQVLRLCPAFITHLVFSNFDPPN